MAETTLITGGCRSGKSRYAQNLAEQAGRKRLFIATAPVLDEEMGRRVAAHKEMRRGRGWETREETLDLADCLRMADGYDAVLCDCLTLWVNNLLYAASQNGVMVEETEIAQRTREACAAAQGISARVFFVTNEIGMGIVPADALSRRFRDLAGRCNQEMADAADSVILMVSGLPIQLKGAGNGNPQ